MPPRSARLRAGHDNQQALQTRHSSWSHSMVTDPKAASTRSIDAWVTGSRDRLLQELTGTVDHVFADVAAFARDRIDAVRQQFETEEIALRRQLAEALDKLEQHQEQTRSVLSQLEKERAAKDSAEIACAAAETAYQQSVAGYADRIRGLELELEASRTAAGSLARDLSSQRAEHSRVLEILHSVRSVLGGGTPSTATNPSGPGLVMPAEPPAETRQQPQETAAATRTESPRPAPAPDSAPSTNVLWSEYASQLLDQIESSYHYDAESSERSSEIVDHLIEYLRIGRELFLARFKDEGIAMEEFDRQLSIALNTKGATAFGRHLAIAWYAITQPVQCDTPSAVV